MALKLLHFLLRYTSPNPLTQRLLEKPHPRAQQAALPLHKLTGSWVFPTKKKTILPPLTQRLLEQPHPHAQQLLPLIQLTLPRQPAARLHKVGLGGIGVVGRDLGGTVQRLVII